MTLVLRPVSVKLVPQQKSVTLGGSKTQFVPHSAVLFGAQEKLKCVGDRPHGACVDLVGEGVGVPEEVFGAGPVGANWNDAVAPVAYRSGAAPFAQSLCQLRLA